MVFRSASDTHQTSPHRDATMASSTFKSHHPLHNFPLQDLKWSMNPTNNHRFRKLAAAADSSHKSPHRDTADSHAAKTKNSVASPDRGNDMSDKKSEASDTATLDNLGKKSKIFIRIKTKSSKCAYDSADAEDQTSVMDDAEETTTKTWNLRPRRAVTKAPNGNGDAPKLGGAVAQFKAQEPSRPELTRSLNANNEKVAEKKEKEKEKRLKLSIPLTKEEIEEDVYALTRSKPARRPKKRPKHVQKQLDCLFPGLWLSSITPDVYRVSDAPPKG